MPLVVFFKSINFRIRKNLRFEKNVIHLLSCLRTINSFRKPRRIQRIKKNLHCLLVNVFGVIAFV